jgi:hypothetical protein
MLLPSKVATFESSVLSKLPVALNIVSKESKSPAALFAEMSRSVKDIAEYIETLDCLYALGKIDFNKKTRLIDYVG